MASAEAVDERFELQVAFIDLCLNLVILHTNSYPAVPDSI